MFTFIHKHWHIWQASRNKFIVSNEDTKKLTEFSTIDGAINFLYFNDNIEAARALNKAYKEHKK